MPANRFGSTITRQQTDANTLRIDEDITFNNAHIGGISVIFTFRTPDAQKLSSFNVVSNVADQTHLDQQVDLLYNGAVFMRLSVTAEPSPGDTEAPFNISIETSAVGDPTAEPPISIATQRLA